MKNRFIKKWEQHFEYLVRGYRVVFSKIWWNKKIYWSELRPPDEWGEDENTKKTGQTHK